MPQLVFKQPIRTPFTIHDEAMIARNAIPILMSLFCTLTQAGEWRYSVKHDSFDNSSTQTAVVRSEEQDAISIVTSSNGEPAVYVTGERFECFQNCLIRVKFDDDMPLSFAASGPRLISAGIRIHDFQRFVDRIKTAKSVVIRAPLMNSTRDLSFSISSAYDPSRFAAAEKAAAISKQCQDNAVSENYQDCMNRMSR